MPVRASGLELRREDEGTLIVPTPGIDSRFKKPSQARSIATVANILDAAHDIVAEAGIQGFNTNAVALRAGINIGTVYHYFPDKLAILVQLLLGDQRSRTAALREKLNELPTASNLPLWSHQLMALVRLYRFDHPTSVLMRRAFHSVPELVVLDNINTARATSLIADLLRQRFPHIDEERTISASRLIIDTMTAIMESSFAGGPNATAFFAEAQTLLDAYLETLH